MNESILTVIALLFALHLPAQTQLEIQGDPSSTDTVAIIKVNYSGFSSDEAIGLVVSTPESIIGKGIAGSFWGARRGLVAGSDNGIALFAESHNGLGLSAKSNMNSGIVGVSQLNQNLIFNITDKAGVIGISDDTIGVLGISIKADGYGLLGKATAIRGRAVKGIAYGENSIGSMGIATAANSTGVWGDGYTGGFFRGSNGTAIQLGGAVTNYSNPAEGADDAVIRSQKSQIHGDFILVTNDEMAIRLDDDGNSTSHFKVFNGDSVQIFSLDEGGNLTITGTYSPSSDINRKENFRDIDYEEILEKLASLPITEWQFKGETARHIGPMAQDFHDAFGLGQSRTTIATVDADGIIMAAIQAQLKLFHHLQQETRSLQEEIKRMRTQFEIIKDFTARLEQLESTH